jgi:hypothetical protein
VFRIGAEKFGLPLSSVLEVFELRVPPEAVPGIINHQGQVFPAIDAAAALGLPAPERAGQAILLYPQEEKLVLVVEQIEAPDHVHPSDGPTAADGWVLLGNERVRLLDPVDLAIELHARMRKHVATHADGPCTGAAVATRCSGTP